MKHSLLIAALLLSPGVAAQPAATAGFIADYAEAHDFNGSILIQKQGRISYATSFGLANIPFKVPNTTQTRYKIASITKLFTAVLILQLVDQDRLDLDEPISTYLPDYAGSGAETITVHELLNHTSGLPNFDAVKDAETAIQHGLPVYQLPHTSNELLASFSNRGLVNVPGEVFDYNNGDYIVLGKIIERIHGKPFDQVLREQILQPLRLDDTGMLRQSEIVERLADTYFYREDLKVLANDLPVYPENWYAAGAMYSTANDILTFANALFGAKLIRPETLRKMLEPGLDDYGYGLWSYRTTINGKKTSAAKRPGRIMGAQSQLYRLSEYDITIVILSNTGTTDLDEFVAEIGKRVADAGR